MTQAPRATSAQPMTAAIPGVFYGWRIVGGAFVILFFTVGIGLYSPSVFLKPLEESFGWNRAGISAGSSIAALVGGMVSPLVGGWIDRYGARSVMTFGGLMLGAAFALLSVMSWLRSASCSAISRPLSSSMRLRSATERPLSRASS